MLGSMATDSFSRPIFEPSMAILNGDSLPTHRLVRAFQPGSLKKPTGGPEHEAGVKKLSG